MRLKQKQRTGTRKNVHMPIQPVTQQRNYQTHQVSQKMSKFQTENRQSNTLNSPDSLLYEQNLAEDSIVQNKNYLQETNNSIKQSTREVEIVKNSKQLIEKEGQNKQKIISSYLFDHQELILKPIARHLIQFGLFFIFIFTVLRVFWTFQDMSQRRDLEEVYLKNLMNKKLTKVQIQYQHGFTLLNSIKQIYSFEISQYALNQKNQSNCSDFSGKYICQNYLNNSIQFYKTIDMNFQLIEIEVQALINHVNISNIFIFSTDNQGIIVFDINKIAKQYFDSKSFPINYQNAPHNLTSKQLLLISTFIKGYQKNQTEQKIVSYLDSANTKVQRYEWWQIYIFDQATDLDTNNFRIKFDLYCFPFALTYGTVQDNVKACISMQTSYKLQNSNNILFIKTQFPKVFITQNSLINYLDHQTQIVEIYDRFNSFMSSEVSEKYIEYQIDKQFLIQCLQYHDSFYQMFADEYLELQVFRCYQSQHMHMLISKYIFSWAILDIDKISYHNAPFNIKLQEQFEIQYFIFSNYTYFANAHEITRNGVQSIQNCIKLFGLMIILTIFSLQFSKSIIKDKLLNSLFTLKKLSKLVKNVDQINQSQKQFNRIIKQINQNKTEQKIQILQIIVGYLRKFLWIKKLYYYNRKKIKNNSMQKLLYLGLRLFKYSKGQINEQKNQTDNLKNNKQSNLQGYKTSKVLNNQRQTQNLINSDKSIEDVDQNDESQAINLIKYPGVLSYIYEELIYLECQKIRNLKNVRLLSKKRQSVRKNSNQMNLFHEIKNQNPKDEKVHYNFQQQNFGRNDSFIKGQAIPIILQNKYHQNKGVRFSKDIHLKGFNQQQKKSKFRQNIRSNSSIGKKSSLKSLKSIQSQVKRKMDESQKQSRSQQNSVAQSTSKKIKRQTTIKKLLMGEQSVHQGLKTMKFDQSLNSIEGKSNIKRQTAPGVGSQNIQDQEQEQITQFFYSHKKIYQRNAKSYRCIVQHYEQIIQIKEKNIQKMVSKRMISYEQEQQLINQMYDIEIMRLKMCYKYLKTLLFENKNEEIQLQKIKIDFNYDHLVFYQNNYQIKQELLDKATLYKMKISICLGKTVSYKKLEEICDSENIQIALQAKFLYAEELSKLQPFLDFQVIHTCSDCFYNYQTSISFKRKALELMMQTLEKVPDQFPDEIQQLQLIKRFYNRKHKKFYFIADMSESYDIFTPVLTKIYQLMGKMDLMQIYNLGMENIGEMQLVGQIIKPQNIETFISLFQQLTLDSEKSKQRNSQKIIHKRLANQKDFNDILDEIQKDKTQFSSFLVIILGADQVSNHSSVISDDVDSSNNQRQLNQLLYSEINRKIQRNYYHIIEIGTNLNNFMTKQGKLKKHIKNSFDLLQVDLVKKSMNQHFSQLEKFINS